MTMKKTTKIIVALIMGVVGSMMISCANPNGSDDYIAPIPSNPSNHIDDTNGKSTRKWTVTFKCRNDIIKTVEVGYGEKIPNDEIPAEPTKEGHTFDEWGGFDFDNIITKNTTINATFKKNVYVVTFKDSDGTVIDTKNVYYGNKVTRPNDLESDSEKCFAGWKNGDNRFDFNSDVIKSDTELVAYYKERIYLSFNVGYNNDKGFRESGLKYGVKSSIHIWKLKYHLDTCEYTTVDLNPYDYLTIKINCVELKAVDTSSTEKFIPNKDDVLSVEIKESEKYKFTILNDLNYGNIDIYEGSYTF